MKPVYIYIEKFHKANTEILMDTCTPQKYPVYKLLYNKSNCSIISLVFGFNLDKDKLYFACIIMHINEENL